MNLYMLVLRLTHILSAVVWVGGVFTMAAFVEPAIRATAPAGQQVMQHMVTKGRFSRIMAIASGLVVLAGALMYWQDSGGLQLLWITTPPGVAFTLGAIFGILSAVVGVGLGRRTSDRLMGLAGRVQAAGKPPTPEQGAELAALSKRLTSLIRWTAVLMVGAVFFMATARYW